MRHRKEGRGGLEKTEGPVESLPCLFLEDREDLRAPQMRRRHQENLEVHGSGLCLAERGHREEAGGTAGQVVGS